MQNCCSWLAEAVETKHSNYTDSNYLYIALSTEAAGQNRNDCCWLQSKTEKLEPQSKTQVIGEAPDW